MKINIKKFLKIGISTAVLSSCLVLSNGNFNEPSFTPVSVEAATVTKYTTTANVNLRSTNSTKGKVLLTIPKGKQVTYIKKSGNWYKVKYKGKTGWVKATYIKKTTNTSTVKKIIYSTTANLHLRSTNSTKGKVLLTIPKGKQVTYLKKSGNWYKVKYKGKIGWVNAKYIKKTTKITSSNNATKPRTPNSDPITPTDPTTELPEGQEISKTVVYPATKLNFRESNSSSSTLLGTIPKFTKLATDYKTKNGWYKVSYKGKTGFVSGTYLITQATKDRISSLEKNKKSYLFMDLRTKSSVTANQINDYINRRVGSNRSVLKNSGKYFIAAGEKYGVNALYLAAHAIHESNFGKSTIALDRNNLFGYGAYDIVPYIGSVKFASIEQSINFVAQKMKATYLGNSYLNKGTYLGYMVKSITGVRIDSLSKGMNYYYASDPYWGEGIARHMSNILDYSKEKAKDRKPNTKIPSIPEYPSGSDVFPNGTLAIAKNPITLYSSKSTGAYTGVSIKKGNQFNLLEKDNNYWLKVKYKNKTYYAKVAFSSYNKYFTVKNLARISSGGLNVNLREKANVSSKKLGTVKHKQYIELVLDKNKKPIKQNNFYKIKVKVNGEETVCWVSALYVVQELNK